MKFLVIFFYLYSAAVSILQAAPAGSIDESFNVGTGPNSSITTLVPLANNKVLVGGSFNSWNSINVLPLLLLNPDGSREPSFQAPRGTYTLRAIKLKADGKILISGSFHSLDNHARTNLAQLLPNGSLDLGFAANTDNYVADMLELPDGRILITGAFEKVNGIDRPGIAILLPSGKVDASWVPPSGITGTGRSLYFSPRTGICVAGLSWSDGFQTITGLIRIATNGLIDRAFDLGAPSFFADRIFSLPCNQILLRSSFFPTRVLANDSIDEHFVNGTGSDLAEISGMQSDGRFFFSGSSLKDETGANSTFLRAFADGRIDPSFKTQIDGTPEISIERADGKIMVAGLIAPKGQSRKYNLLALHGNDVSAPTTVQWNASHLGSVHHGTIGLQIVRDGNRSEGTSLKWNIYFNPAVAQIIPSSESVTFAPGESVKELKLNISSLPQNNAVIHFEMEDVQNAAIGTNKTLALYLTNEITTITLTGDTVSAGETTGLFSSTLDRKGALNRPVAVGWRLKSSAPKNSQLVLRSGFAHFPAGRDIASVYNRVVDDALVNGDQTNEFELFTLDQETQLGGSTNGVVVIQDNDLPGYPARGADNSVAMSAKLSDGGLLIYGSFTSVNGVNSPGFARLSRVGSLDSTFIPPAIKGTITEMEELPTGKILLSGKIQKAGDPKSYSLLRLNPNGSIDDTFRPDALPATPLAFAVVPDGILVTGSTPMFNGTQKGTNRGVVIKLNHEGRRDLNFLTSTATFDVENTPFINASRVHALSNGKFYVFGNIAAAAKPYAASGQVQPPTLNVGLALFKADGTFDPQFRTEVSYISAPGIPRPAVGMDLVQKIQPYPDGKVLVTGHFNQVNGKSTPGFVRLLPNGSLDLSFQANVLKVLPKPLQVVDVALSPNGEILLMVPSPVTAGPTPHPLSGVVRLNPDGTRKSIINMGSNSLWSGTVQVFDNGSAFVGSTFTSLDGVPAYRMAWLTSNGLRQVHPETHLQIQGDGINTYMVIHSLVTGNFDLQQSFDLESWNLFRSLTLQRGTNIVPVSDFQKEEYFRLHNR